MSLSDDTGPYCSRQWPTDFKKSGAKVAAAAEVHGAACSPQGKRGDALGSFGQPRFPKTLNHQLRVRLSAPSDPRSNRKVGIDLKQTRRRLTRLSVTSEMGESGRETAIGLRIERVLTLGFLACDDCLVKATKLNEGKPDPTKRVV
jgi:hypothetical protein